MHEHSPDDPTTIVDVSRGSLDDFATETTSVRRLIDITAAGLPSTAQPKSLSRIEASEARRRRHSRLTRVARAGRATRQRWSLAATAAGHRGRAIVGYAWTRAHERLVTKATATATRSRMHDPEADGVIIASLLAIVAVTYGSFLTATWRQPVDARVAQVPAPPPRTTTASPVEAAVAPVTAVAAVVNTPQPLPAAAAEPIVVRRTAAAMTTRSLTAMWKQRDTRSLEQAFDGLRRQTLAFHRCGMRVTGNDRAVARCDGAGGAWTIDFQRLAGRWQIADVVNR